MTCFRGSTELHSIRHAAYHGVKIIFIVLYLHLTVLDHGGHARFSFLQERRQRALDRTRGTHTASQHDLI